MKKPPGPPETGAEPEIGAEPGIGKCQRCGEQATATDGRGPGLAAPGVIYRFNLCLSCNNSLAVNPGTG